MLPTLSYMIMLKCRPCPRDSGFETPLGVHMPPRASGPRGAYELPRGYQSLNPLGRVSIFYQIVIAESVIAPSVIGESPSPNKFPEEQE